MSAPSILFCQCSTFHTAMIKIDQVKVEPGTSIHNPETHTIRHATQGQKGPQAENITAL